MGKEIRLTYIGRKIVGGKTYQIFRDGKSEHPFRGIARISLGGVYIAELSGEKLSMARKPTCVGHVELTKEELRRDELVSCDLREQREARAAKKKVEKWKEFPQLAKLVDGLSYSETRQLIEAIICRAIQTNRKAKR